MSKYAGTKTEKNLMEAFAGESQARNKYTFFASAAKKAGYEQLAALYLETADQEKEHAKMWFKEFHGIHDIETNLEDAAQGENFEWTDMYAKMAREARRNTFSAREADSLSEHGRHIGGKRADAGDCCSKNRRQSSDADCFLRQQLYRNHILESGGQYLPAGSNLSGSSYALCRGGLSVCSRQCDSGGIRSAVRSITFL